MVVVAWRILSSASNHNVQAFGFGGDAGEIEARSRSGANPIRIRPHDEVASIK